MQIFEVSPPPVLRTIKFSMADRKMIHSERFHVLEKEEAEASILHFYHEKSN